MHAGAINKNRLAAALPVPVLNMPRLTVAEVKAAGCTKLGILAIGAPGVPGGTVMASLGIVTSVLGFGAEGTALLLAIFAIQDSFGTACNVTGDGALTLILTGYCEKHGLAEQKNIGVDL